MQKTKILYSSSIKEIITKAKYFFIINFIDYLINIMDEIFFEDIKDYRYYKNCALAYCYYLSIIFYDCNWTKLDIWFWTNLSSFYIKYNKNSKKTLKNIFKFIYYQIKQKLIVMLTTKIKI